MKRIKTENQAIALEVEAPTAKTKSKLLVLCIQTEDGTIERVLTGDNYDQLWLQGSTEAKAIGGYWTTYDVHGRFIDGNYHSKAESK